MVDGGLEGYVRWGGTGQAKVLRECLSSSGLPLLAVFDNDATLKPPFADVPLLCGLDGFKRWLSGRKPPVNLGFLVAIGGEGGETRLQIQSQLAAEQLRPLVALHPSAFLASNADVGEGSQVLAQAAVCAEARIGRACIVNTGAVVDHECQLADGVHVCPNATLAGLVRVGRCATIGSGAVILPRCQIGAGAVVGAGALVREDVPEHAVVVGNPARQVGRREPELA